MVAITIPQIKPIRAIASAKTSEIKSLTNIVAELALAMTKLEPKTPTVKAATILAKPTDAHPNP